MNSPARSTSPLAIVSLVSGIVSWVAIPFIGAIVAIVTGHMARAEIRRAPATLEGDGLAIGGLILGYLQLALCIVGIAVLFLFFGGLAIIGMSQG
ncbi:DUF4190 domain-containing protein [Chiayiivirga flava]|uniref:DUF4190 domain-containing protein n=1 Tax=Chiayiivirga flava TaxID=659595 RepID=A0A7W8D2Y2_9GAMM|nr:DUF4190 domain-containing protein [Chiayiivirga flava]MBB5206983.1 hypothetical protein [Chiayiivirga flava]